MTTKDQIAIAKLYNESFHNDKINGLYDKIQMAIFEYEEELKGGGIDGVEFLRKFYKILVEFKKHPLITKQDFSNDDNPYGELLSFFDRKVDILRKSGLISNEDLDYFSDNHRTYFKDSDNIFDLPAKDTHTHMGDSTLFHIKNHIKMLERAIALKSFDGIKSLCQEIIQSVEKYESLNSLN